MDLLPLAQTLTAWMAVAALVLLAISSLLTVAEKTGFLDFVPAYRKHQEEKERVRVRQLLDTLNELVLRQEDQRTARLLDALGISNRQFQRQIRQAVEFVNAMTAKHIDALTDQLLEICKRFTVDQNEHSARGNIVLYPQVRYYVDLTRPSMNPIYVSELARIAQALICATASRLQQDSKYSLDYNKIVMPKGGNFSLGLKLSEKLNKELVVMLGEPRVTTNCRWIGSLSNDDRAIVLNDVGVTGDRLVAAIEDARNAGAEVGHVFLLVERSDFDLRAALGDLEQPVRVNSLLVLSDQDIAAWYDA